MEKKLSIIVPIYKVEKYLRRCIDSLLAQDLSLEEYEIILVDDGSPDKCGEIADEYAERYPNIKVIHQENGGLGAARNSGMLASEGKYIQFVDSDDYLDPNVVRALVERCEKDNLDVLRFNYRNVDEDGKQFHPNREYRPFVDYSESVTDGRSFLEKSLGFACYAWQFVLRARLIKESQLSFKPGFFFEDVEWTPLMLSCALRVSSLAVVIYNYTSRKESITSADSPEKQSKIIEDKLALVSFLKGMESSDDDSKWFGGMISRIVISLLSMDIMEGTSVKFEIIGNLKQMKVFPLSLYHISGRARYKACLINISPMLYCGILKAIRAI